MTKNKHRFVVSLLVIFLLFCFTISVIAVEPATLWNLDEYLKNPPKVTWGEKVNPFVQEVYYEGEPYQGQPTQIFAYFGTPKDKEYRNDKFPAILLIHGGGGKAFAEWAERWAKRGYFALAMDLNGQGPDKPLPDGVSLFKDIEIFRDFTIEDGDYKNMWTYQAIAAILRGHALLIAQKEIDPDKIAVTGISWGGYLTCILAGADNQLQAAVPVYGCGFLHENSVWKGNWFGRLNNWFEKMTPEHQNRWVSLFDPSSHLGRATMPMLFVNGTNDGAYPLDSYRKTCQLPKGDVTLSVTLRRPHGHIFTFNEVDTFIDSIVLKNTKPLPKISAMKLNDDKKTVSVTFESEAAITKAELAFTTNTGIYANREWKTIPAKINGKTISAELPTPVPTCYYILITDERGLPVSSPINILQ
ncbi:MAG: S9 family peptidase [Planctomycetaceae bacterium]|nr:S9 family peptidase [Planctomycetaceae bacterium]